MNRLKNVLVLVGLGVCGQLFSAAGVSRLFSPVYWVKNDIEQLMKEGLKANVSQRKDGILTSLVKSDIPNKTKQHIIQQLDLYANAIDAIKNQKFAGTASVDLVKPYAAAKQILIHLLERLDWNALMLMHEQHKQESSSSDDDWVVLD